VVEGPDNKQPDLKAIEKALNDNNDISHVAVVESETTSGIVNDVTRVGEVVKKYKKTFIVDAMSSFGAYPTDFKTANIDYLVSSSNKNIEGLPGFAIVIARKSALEADKGNARSLSLDIHSQRAGLDKDGQFRFTPPTHSILAFHQALLELDM
jgi:2-aminoethylphosphonate-pyruvate transaminase